ncbi:hypothetical protein EX30DRAFT_380134 [Ascodesmis nigricans]|uniref:Uncharacterized protein n=1 Tax=Ascodesmis nigricans TaxID=341454 RepID=A0A4S2MU02_9PEZI|nr:hypothetical protein EX30DRAFT_380134 [Ascodesmis nigricans]
MAAYIPDKVKELNEYYNPLSSTNRPSQAHGKYLYLQGMAQVSYGELTQSPTHITSGSRTKAEAIAEMQAAKAGASAREFAEMVGSADPSGAVGAGSAVMGEAARGVGMVAGEGRRAGSAGAEGVIGGGEKVVEAGREGGEAVVGGVGKVVGGVGEVGKGVQSGVGGFLGGK